MAFQKLKDGFNTLAAPLVNLTAKQAATVVLWQAWALFVLNGALLRRPDSVKLTLMEMAVPALFALQGALTGALLGESAYQFKKETAKAPDAVPATPPEGTAPAAAPAKSLSAYFHEQVAAVKQNTRERLECMKTPAKVGAALTYGAMSLLSIGLSFPGK